MKLIIEAIEKQLQKQKDELFVKEIIIEDLKNQLDACKKELEDRDKAIENLIAKAETKAFEKECAE